MAWVKSTSWDSSTIWVMLSRCGKADMLLSNWACEKVTSEWVAVGLRYISRVVTGVEWYVGVIPFLVRRLHFCHVSQDPVRRAYLPLRRWTLRGMWQRAVVVFVFAVFKLAGGRPRPIELPAGQLVVVVVSCVLILHLWHAAGVKWYVGVISHLVRGLEFCHVQEEPVWGIHLSHWGWTFPGSRVTAARSASQAACFAVH